MEKVMWKRMESKEWEIWLLQEQHFDEMSGYRERWIQNLGLHFSEGHGLWTCDSLDRCLEGQCTQIDSDR